MVRAAAAVATATAEGGALFWFDAEVEVQREGASEGGGRPSPAMQCCAALANHSPSSTGRGGVTG